MLEINIFEELFLSQEIWSYLGPFALLVIGYVLAKKDKALGVLWFLLECIFAYYYMELISSDPFYIWHAFFLVVGGILTCVFPLIDR